MSLGKNITTLREHLNIKEKELAFMVGISQPYISAIENDKKTPSVEVLCKIALALNTTCSELLDETPQHLSADMKRLVKSAENLSSKQVSALINVVNEFIVT